MCVLKSTHKENVEPEREEKFLEISEKEGGEKYVSVL